MKIIQTILTILHLSSGPLSFSGEDLKKQHVYVTRNVDL
jgi:hypothetical protein